VNDHPQNVGSIVATALAEARARLAWVSEGRVGDEELTLLLDLERDLKGWIERWGFSLARFEVRLDPEDL
jgi:hypothetical protein